MERCRREIAAIEAEILAGNPDAAGLCQALSDWWVELRIIEAEQRQEIRSQRAEGSPQDRETGGGDVAVAARALNSCTSTSSIQRRG
jgi:hypothetical protein